MSFSRKDFYFSLITGFVTGFITWRIFIFLELPEFAGISYGWLIIFVPILWIFGVNIGYFLGRWFTFFNQFGKFAAVGFTNAAVDFGILNLLLALSGIAAGITFSAFKGLSFIVAMLHSYFWNKFWVFEAGESHGGRSEFVKFSTVTVIALLVNVGVASFVVNVTGPLLGLSENIWANVGAVTGSAAALAVSFIGFKLVVFKKSF